MAVRGTDAQVVRTRIDGPVGHVLLDRPEAMNAITVELGRQLEAALRELAADTDVIVIRGAGGNFSVGGDFNEVERLRACGPDALSALFARFADACALIAALPVPVVAAVEGYAMAGGFELMQSCDIAVVTDNAKIADNHSNFAQVPGGGGSQRLPRLVGRQRALAHMLTGDRLSGREAVDWGLAYRSAPEDRFDDLVGELAQRLAAKDRDAAARTKRLVHEGLQLPLAQGLALEMRTVLEHIGGHAGAAGVSRFREQRGTDR